MTSKNEFLYFQNIINNLSKTSMNLLQQEDKINQFKDEVKSNKIKGKEKNIYINNDLQMEPTLSSSIKKNELYINIDNSDEERIKRYKKRPKYIPVKRCNKTTQIDILFNENNTFLTQTSKFLGKKTDNMYKIKNKEIIINKDKNFNIVNIPNNLNNNRNIIYDNEIGENNSNVINNRNYKSKNDDFIRWWENKNIELDEESFDSFLIFNSYKKETPEEMLPFEFK